MDRQGPTIIASVMATFCFLALAVLGRGGIDAFFGDAARITVFIATIVMAMASLFTRGNLDTGVKEDRGNRWIIAVLVIGGFVSAYVPPYADRIDFWTFGGDGLRWIGVILFILGGALRLWPVFVLGRRFSGLVAIQSGHELVTTGIYGTIRNPSYLGLLINAVGWALTFRSVLGLLLVIPYLPALVARMHSEERLLRAHFGAPYEAYFARTWRLIPGLY